MTPTEQDNELREEIQNYAIDFHNSYRPNYPTPDLDALMQLIIADRKRVALEARLDEMKLHRHEWELFGDRAPYEGESVSLPILLAYHDDRIAELKAQKEEV